jgi:hypothetical protein
LPIQLTFSVLGFFLNDLSRSSLLANIVHIDYIETVLKVVVGGVRVATTSVSSDSRVVSISPISDEVRRLKVISCDLCDTGMASYDVFIDGIITKVNVLKRCCDQCVKSFSQQLL